MDALSSFMPRVSSLPGLALKGGMSLLTNPEKTFGVAMIAINAIGAAKDIVRGRMPSHPITRSVGILGGIMLVRSATLAEHNKRLEANLKEQTTLNGAFKDQVETLSAENTQLKATSEALTAQVDQLTRHIAQMERIAALVESVASRTGTNAKQTGEVLAALKAQITKEKVVLTFQAMLVVRSNQLLEKQEAVAQRIETAQARERALLTRMEQTSEAHAHLLEETKAAAAKYDLAASTAVVAAMQTGAGNTAIETKA